MEAVDGLKKVRKFSIWKRSLTPISYANRLQNHILRQQHKISHEDFNYALWRKRTHKQTDTISNTPTLGAHSGSIENTNEESPSPPIKATTLLLLSLKILRVMFCRTHLKMALFSSSFVGSPENCSALLVNRWLFIIATAANLVTETVGVDLFFFFQLPSTVRPWSWEAVSILFRMHKPKRVL